MINRESVMMWISSSLSFRRHILYVVVGIIILFGSAGCTPSLATTAVSTFMPSPAQKSTTSPTSSPLLTTVSPTFTPSVVNSVSATETLNIPLGIGVYNADNVKVFNDYAREYDVIAARPPFLYLLEEVERGQKKIVFAPRDEPLTDVETIISEAKSLGVTFLGYNLEKAFPREELISKEQEMQTVADKNDVLYVFGPTLLKLERFYDDFARYADIILLQSQHYQTAEEYEERVEALIKKIKTTNPEVQVWVQVSVNPPADRHISPDEVIGDIQLIADQADLIWIYYVPDTAPVMEEVMRRLRG